MTPEISIIIPNWNGKAFLNRCLGATIQDAAMSGRTYEVILIDDASTDSSGEEARDRYPSIQYIPKPRNEGFGKAVNDGANAARGKLLILINNDLIPKPGFVKALTDPFTNNTQIFGVSGRTINWQNSEPNHVNMHGRWLDSQVKLTWSDEPVLSETLFVQGGSCAIRKDLFLQFGGFHALFHPGYWEDYDISYLARKAGYQNLYQPAAIGSHLGQGSMIRAHGQDRITFVRERNRILFHLLNLSGPYFDQFMQSLPQYVCRQSEPRFKHRLAILKHIWDHRAELRLERQRRSRLWQLTDEEVLKPFLHTGTFS